MRDLLVALVVAIGAVGAKPLDRGIDEPRVDLLQRVPAEPQPIERGRPEILQEDIRLRDDLAEQPLSLLALQIERQAALVGVE